jgi:GNAT superfamily N-acetyltransferase
MNLHFRRFQWEYYQEYASWFSDPELDRYLGPMGEDWLSAVFSQKAEHGVTWAVFTGTEMVGVIETVFDAPNSLPAGITALAVKPTRCKQGIGGAMLREILLRHCGNGILDHCAYIKTSNEAARQLFEGQGFEPVSEPDKNGYIEYCHHGSPSNSSDCAQNG